MSLSGIKEAELFCQIGPTQPVLSLISPLLDEESSVCGWRMIWNKEHTSSFRSLFKQRSFVFSEVQIFDFSPDFSVPLSSGSSLKTSCTKLHSSHTLPHAAHKKHVFIERSISDAETVSVSFTLASCCSSNPLSSGSISLIYKPAAMC